MRHQFVGPTGYKLYAIQKRIVDRLEQENDAADYAEYWRMDGPAVQVGHLSGRHCVWQTVPILSVELLRRYREMWERDMDIPY